MEPQESVEPRDGIDGAPLICKEEVVCTTETKDADSNQPPVLNSQEEEESGGAEVNVETEDEPDEPTETTTDETQEVDILNTSTEVNENDLVLPSATSSGEVVSSDGKITSEIIYSSMPPDLNIDSLVRASRSPVTGQAFSVSNQNGKLRIHLCKNKESSELLGDRNRPFPCVACRRMIEVGELYINFPEDLDRRRLWGNILGFKYSEMLRFRYGSSSIACAGLICTDHFSEECFRKFNFNKAAIEAFGIPVAVSSSSSLVTPTKKRTPWDCSICSFRSHSVAQTRHHLISHTMGMITSATKAKLRDRGLTCPFCRKCTYGYKTLSGFCRHLNMPPLTHFYLKRINEVAVNNFRSTVLEPAGDWTSWSERNVYYAYHGCEPPAPTPIKRRAPGSVVSVTSKRAMVASSSPTESEAASGGEAQSRPVSRESVESGQDVATRTSEVAVPSSDKPPRKVIMVKSVTAVQEALLPPVIVPAPDPSRQAGRTPGRTPPSILKSPPGCNARLVPSQNRKPVARRVLLEDDIPPLPTAHFERTKDANHENFLSKGATIADVLSDAAETEKDEVGLDVIADTAINPALDCPVDVSWTAYNERISRTQQRKTRRQIEANEARLRLFGEYTDVAVPTGYRQVDTPKGPRIVSATLTPWEARALESACAVRPASVKIANSRLKNVGLMDLDR